MKILIVDDNPANLKLLRVFLESEGFATAQARDPEMEAKIRHHQEYSYLLHPVKYNLLTGTDSLFKMTDGAWANIN